MTLIMHHLAFLLVIVFLIMIGKGENGRKDSQCTFTDAATGKVLDLTNYINTINGTQCSMQGCSGCGFKYTPCKNGLYCASQSNSSMVIQNSVSDGECSGMLAFWDSTIEPTYSKGNGSWTFEYQNGQTCSDDKLKQYQFELVFICTNDSWPQARTFETDVCKYQMTISSMYTC